MEFLELKNMVIKYKSWSFWRQLQQLKRSDGRSVERQRQKEILAALPKGTETTLDGIFTRTKITRKEFKFCVNAPQNKKAK